MVEAGTHLIFDALMCPYRIGERVRALRLLRSVTSGMLLMWDRGLHSYAMVNATVTKACDYLGRIPANVKFLTEKPLADGSYLSWIYPSLKLRKKRFFISLPGHGSGRFYFLDVPKVNDLLTRVESLTPNGIGIMSFGLVLKNMPGIPGSPSD